MKTFAILGAAGTLLAAGAAAAQELPPQAEAAPQAAVPAAAATVVDPAQVATPPGQPDAALDPAPLASSAASFTDAEIASFVTAAFGVRSMQAETAGDASVTTEAKQARAMAIVADAGIDATTYNAIGQSMRVDPALAQRVQVAVTARAAQPEG